MIDNQKIKRDFLKLLGNENPTKEDLQKIDCIPDTQLLKPIVVNGKQKGISLRMISIKYNISIDIIKNISRKAKEENSV